MHDVLKHLNNANPYDLQTLDVEALRRFEVLCDTWAKNAEVELARRRSLPATAAVSGRVHPIPT